MRRPSSSRDASLGRDGPYDTDPGDAADEQASCFLGLDLGLDTLFDAQMNPQLSLSSPQVRSPTHAAAHSLVKRQRV